MNSLRWIAAVVLGLLLQVCSAQVPKDNPVVDAVRAIGLKGLSSQDTPSSSPTKFKPSGTRVYVSSYVKSLFESEEERKVIEPAIVKLIESYENSTKATPLASDTSGALAYSIAILYAAAKGEQLAEEAFPILLGRLKGHLDTSAVRGATDRQKQEAYEWALCSANLVVALLSEASTDDAKAKVQTMASTQLEVLLSAKLSQITLNGKTVEIKGSGGSQPAEKPAEKPAETTGGLAPGFTFQAPGDWVRDNAWYVFSTRDGDNITGAHVRFPAAIPAAGNMGDALRKLWKANVPAPLQNAAGSMVYRRYVGSKLFAQFIFGKGREEGRGADSVFSLFLIDCGKTWQPVVVAQTYRVDSKYNAGEDFSAQYSYPRSADYAEAMLATFRCPGAPNQALVSREALAANYNYGGSAVQQWENIYTGATTMTFNSSSGTLNLAPNGTFTYTLSVASGRVGNAKFAGVKGAGTYVIQGDILICTYTMYDQGDSYKRKEDRYRIAGLTAFTDGSKVAILMSDLKLPVNNVTVAGSSNWYTTKKG